MRSKSQVSEADQTLVLSALTAAGYIAQWDSKYDCAMSFKRGWNTQLFVNPLNDSGQAFQLAVELGLKVDIRLDEGATYVESAPHNLVHGLLHSSSDAMTATMRAVVELAAKIAAITGVKQHLASA